MSRLLRVMLLAAMFAVSAAPAMAGPWSDALEGPSPDPDAVRQLIRHGADVNALEESMAQRKETPLQMIAGDEAANLAIGKMLIEAGADVNRGDPDGDTPLHVAALGGSARFAAMLIAHGARVDARDSAGKTPLHDAAYATSPGVAAVLLAHGAQAMARDKAGDTPMHLLRDGETAGDVNGFVALLLKHGADIQARGEQGNSPLHAAAARNAIVVARTLLEHDADVMARNDAGETPLHAAASASSLRATTEMTKLLLTHGAELEARDNLGMTPLHAAAGAGNAVVAAYLIAQDADVNAVSGKSAALYPRGTTPLHMAVVTGSASSDGSVVQLLVDHGAGILAKNGKGETPLSQAFNPRIRKILEDALKRRKKQPEQDMNAKIQQAVTEAQRRLSGAMHEYNAAKIAVIALGKRGLAAVKTRAKLAQQREVVKRFMRATLAAIAAIRDFEPHVIEKARAVGASGNMLQSLRESVRASLTEAGVREKVQLMRLDMDWTDARDEIYALMAQNWGKWRPARKGEKDVIIGDTRALTQRFTKLIHNMWTIESRANHLSEKIADKNRRH